MNFKEKFKSFLGIFPFFKKNSVPKLETSNLTSDSHLKYDDAVTSVEQDITQTEWKEPDLESTFYYKDTKMPSIYAYDVFNKDVIKYLGNNKYSFCTEHLSLEQNYILLEHLVEIIGNALDSISADTPIRQECLDFLVTKLNPSVDRINKVTKKNNPNKALTDLENLLLSSLNYYNTIINDDIEFSDEYASINFNLVSESEKKEQYQDPKLNLDLVLDLDFSSDSDSNEQQSFAEQRKTFVDNISISNHNLDQTKWKKPDSDSVFYYKSNKLLHIHPNDICKEEFTTYLGGNSYSFTTENLSLEQNYNLVKELLYITNTQLDSLTSDTSKRQECKDFLAKSITRVKQLDSFAKEKNLDRALSDLEGLLMSSINYYDTIINDDKELPNTDIVLT